MHLMKLHPQVTQIGSDWAGGGHTELYLLQGDVLAIIDTGTQESPQNAIIPAMQSMGLELKDIDIILNTHGHHDHSGGNAEVQATSGCRIYIHEADSPFLEDPEAAFDKWYSAMYRAMGGPEHLIAERLAFVERIGKQTRVGQSLKEGDTIDLGKGLALKVLHFPGHTPGSIGYWWEQEGVLFSGDCFPGLGSRPGGIMVMLDPVTYEASLEKAKAMPLHTLACAHHYRCLSLEQASIRKGDDIKTYLVECQTISQHMRQVAGAVARALPEQPFVKQAQAMIGELGKEWDVSPTPEGTIPPLNAITLYAYLSKGAR